MSESPEEWKENFCMSHESFEKLCSVVRLSLREKCSNMEFFPVSIFLYSNWKQWDLHILKIYCHHNKKDMQYENPVKKANLNGLHVSVAAGVNTATQSPSFNELPKLSTGLNFC